MYEDIRKSLNQNGFYVGTVDDFCSDMPAYFQMARKTTTEIYEQAKKTNNIRWTNSIHGSEGNAYPNYLELSEVEERKRIIKEKNLRVDQQWYFFGDEQLQDYHKLIQNLIFALYPDVNENNICHNSRFTLYENEDFTDLHIDSYVKNLKCAFLMYLSNSEDYQDGGGKLLLTKYQTRRVADSVPPVLPYFVIIDAENHQLYHGVDQVKNNFKRFAFLDFISMKEVNN